MPFSPPIEDRATLLVIATATAAFVAHFYGLSARAWQDRSGGGEVSRTAVARHRWAGLLVLGVAPILLVGSLLPWPSHHYGLALPMPLRTLAWCAMAAVMAPLSWRTAAQPSSWWAYPEDRTPAPWSSADQARNAALWIPYLVGYEALFRGVLFFGLTEPLGFWVALAVSTALYVLAHLHKPAVETLGSAVAGVVFAVATWHSGSIWAVVVTHIVIAAGAETAAIRAQGEYATQTSST